MEEKDKIYFLPGDVVTLRQDIPNKPTMVVCRVETGIFKHIEDGEKKNTLRGIKCRWFTNDGKIQEAIFNTKDLIKIK